MSVELQKLAMIATIASGAIAVMAYIDGNNGGSDVIASGNSVVINNSNSSSSSNSSVVNNVVNNQVIAGDGSIVVAANPQPHQIPILKGVEAESLPPSNPTEPLHKPEQPVSQSTTQSIDTCSNPKLMFRFQAAKNMSGSISRDRALGSLTEDAYGQEDFGCAFSFTKQISGSITRDRRLGEIVGKMLDAGLDQQALVVINRISGSITRDRYLSDLVGK